MVERLLLIRHAETEAGSRALFVGATDVDAAPQGLNRLDRLRPVLEHYAPEQWYCSPMKRAIQSVERLCPQVKTEYGYRVDERLREIDFGRWEMKGFDEIAAQEPGLVESWKDFDTFVFPGGEAVADFQQRVAGILDYLRTQPVGVLAAVTHGGVIRTMICLALGLDPGDYLLFNVRPGTLTVLDLYPEGAVLSAMGV